MIDDGEGSGNSIGVTDENRMKAESVTINSNQHVNEHHEEMYSVMIDQTTASTDDQFVYIKNTNDIDLHITSVAGFTSADTEVYMLLGVTGTSTTPTTVTPANRNAGSGKTADATVQKGADLQLTGGSEVERIRLDSANTEVQKFKWESHMILPKNSTMVLTSSAAATINLTIAIYFHNGD